MKKYQIVLVSIAGLLMLVWIVGRSTNMLQYFSVPTFSNTPTFKTGSHFLASNLITPKRFDFICYRKTDPEYGKQIWFHRICGMPGDTVEIRNGDLYVNGVSRDEAFNLKKVYRVPNRLIDSLSLDEIELNVTSDSTIAPLETQEQKRFIQQSLPYHEEFAAPETEKIYGKPWTIDNFGPYIVPPQHYFVMGDNRSRSADSRFFGPIDKKDVVATVIH